MEESLLAQPSDLKCDIPEDLSRLVVLKRGDRAFGIDAIVTALKQDRVTLIRDASAQYADDVIMAVAESFGLKDQLLLEAGFASIRGHRDLLSKYFMSVAERADYQFIPPHSEGHPAADMQLAAFYCFENSTDGGETILLNTDSEDSIWNTLLGLEKKVTVSEGQLSASQLARLKALHKVNASDFLLSADDEVLCERESLVSDVKLFDVLARPKETYSRILDRKVKVYWDSVSSIDFDSGREYLRLLHSCGLVREPSSGIDAEKLDYNYLRGVRNFGVKYEQLFRTRINQKLSAGDLLILNNMTWTHSVSNWTPGSGIRKVAGAFA